MTPLRALVLPTALLVAACASSAAAGQKPKIEPAPPAGFLTDYELLQTHADDPLTRVWMSSQERLGDYDSFLVDPVELMLVPGSIGEQASTEELEMLREDLAASFREILTQAGYRSVLEPGPGTLRVSLAITDVRPVGKGSRAGNIAAGTAAGVAAPGVGFFLPRFKVGYAAIELELSDSETNELIGAAMSTRRGKRALAGMKAYKRWGDARGAFRSWAKQFRDAVDEAHGRGVHRHNSNLDR